MSETMKERMRVDARLRTVAMLHAADEDHRTMMISGEGWVCASCDDDYGRMVAWAVEAGKAMWEAGPVVEVYNDGMKCSATGELFQPTGTDDVWWDRAMFDHVAEWYPSAIYVGVDDVLFADEVPEEADDDEEEEMTAVAFMEYLCEDSGMCGSQIADIRPAKGDGWLVEDGVALVETGDGRRFIVTVEEVTR